MKTTHEIIKSSLSRFNPGSIIFPNDFRSFGSQSAIKMALSRLSRTGEIKRIAHGIYYRPMIDPILGELIPSAEAVAKNLAEREHIRIRPTGAFALNKLGLSTQVPTKLVYLTDGHPRKLKLGKLTVEFKATTPKKMALSGPISSLLILALSELDLEHLSEEMENKIMRLLQHEERGVLEQDMQLAPVKVYNYLMRMIKKIDEKSIFHDIIKQHDRLA